MAHKIIVDHRFDKFLTFDEFQEEMKDDDDFKYLFYEEHASEKSRRGISAYDEQSEFGEIEEAECEAISQWKDEDLYNQMLEDHEKWFIDKIKSKIKISSLIAIMNKKEKEEYERIQKIKMIQGL